MDLDTGNLEHLPPDLADLPGRLRVKRALEVAATGGHPIALLGEHPDRDVFARALAGLSPAEGARVVDPGAAELGVVVPSAAPSDRHHRGPRSDMIALEVARIRQVEFPLDRLTPKAVRILEVSRDTLRRRTRDWATRERAIRRVAATIAAMDRKNQIDDSHIGEAITFQLDLLGDSGGGVDYLEPVER